MSDKIGPEAAQEVPVLRLSAAQVLTSGRRLADMCQDFFLQVPELQAIIIETSDNPQSADLERKRLIEIGVPMVTSKIGDDGHKKAKRKANGFELATNLFIMTRSYTLALLKERAKAQKNTDTEKVIIN